MLRLGLEELSARASVIAQVRVLGAQTHWVGPYLHTEYECVVESALRGAAAGTVLRVRTPGGALGRVGQRVEGAPSLASGQRYVLFLEAARAQVCEPSEAPVEASGPVRECAGRWHVVGLAQGAMPLEVDGRVHAPALPEGVLVERPGASARTAMPPEGLSLEGLAQRLGLTLTPR